MHQSFLGTRLTGLWWNNSLSFNLIFFCFFSSSFVCLFPWFWLLSFLRRYVHLFFPNASPSLSSQVLLVVRHAFVSSSFFLYVHTEVFFVFVISCIFIDSFEPVSVQSFIQPVVCSYSYLCGLKGGRRARLPPRGLGLGMLCDHFTKQSDPLFSLCCCGHSIWSVFLEAALSFLSIQQAQKRSSWLSSRPTHLPFDLLLFGV